MRARLVLVTATLVMAPAMAGAGETCRVLRMTLQPDCFRLPGLAGCDRKRLDMGPQVAVWIESADGGRFETLMVTNLTAVRGLGNRPGRWDFRSNPRWPYGRRRNALPIWAHRRGRLYPAVTMTDGAEDALGYHEAVSSPDPYYCRPIRPDEVIDAVTCPTSFFDSVKGKLDVAAPAVLYPPRQDLVAFTSRDCDQPGVMPCPAGATSAERFADVNDLDAVAAATPPYGRPARLLFRLPASFPDGPAVVFVEVAKEFDGNAAHVHPSFEDPLRAGYGAADNFGQPSVVWTVPTLVDGSPHDASATRIAGYADWDGATGEIHSSDATISDSPGSGQGRLLELPGGDGARVQVHVEGCETTCEPSAPPPGPVRDLAVAAGGLQATEVEVVFLNADDGGAAVASYEVRYREGGTLDESTFGAATPVEQVTPGLPGTPASVRLAGLKPQSAYAVGVRARGRCLGESHLSTVAFTTPARRFTTLSGCFIATATFGSSLHPAVVRLRALRDVVRARSAVGAALVDVYERSSPPLAAVIARSGTMRAAARVALGPLVRLGAP